MAIRGRKARTTDESETTVTQTETLPETEAPAEGQESADTETETAETTHVFNTNDTVRVVRGKHRTRVGTVLKHSKTAGTYAVELESGELITVNAGNLKPPADSTVSVRALVEVLARFQESDPDVINRLASALDAVAPEVSVKLAEARAN